MIVTDEVCYDKIFLPPLQRAGVKLKLRPVVFSARIFDFFDPSVMPGLRHANYDLAGSRFSAEEVEFTPRVTGVRTNPKTGAREANVRWAPENLYVYSATHYL